MKFSFVIPTVDRELELQDCILSIDRAYDCMKSSDISIEIIVVYNGADKNTSSLNIQYPNFTHVYHINEKGTSRARNFGIVKSTGEYLIFIDDDATISKEFLYVLSNNILNKQETKVFYGRLLNPLNNDPFSGIYEMTESKYLGYFDYRYSGGTSLALKRSVFDKIGLYDEKFGPGGKYPAAEESDLFFKMLRSGEKILYLPELVIFHPVSRDTPYDKVYNYSYAIGAMLMKQMLCDPKKILFYFLIIIMMTFKSGIRALQNILLPETIKEKNKRFQYYSAFTGTLKGVIDYAING